MEKREKPSFISQLTLFVIVTVISSFGVFYGSSAVAVAVLCAGIVLFPLWESMLSICAVTIIVYFMGDGNPTLLTYLIPGLLCGYAMKYHLPNRLTLALSCLGMVVSVFAIEYAMFAEQGMTLSQGIISGVDAQTLSDMQAIGLNAEPIAYSALIFSAVMSGGAVFVIARIVVIVLQHSRFIPADRRDKPLINKISPMRMWMLSDGFTVGLIASVVFIIAVNAFDAPNAELMSYCTATIFLTLLFLQGITYVMYLLTLQRIHGQGFGKRILILLAVIITMPLGFVVMGLYDQITHSRRKSYEKEKKTFDELSGRGQKQDKHGDDTDDDKND